MSVNRGGRHAAPGTPGVSVTVGGGPPYSNNASGPSTPSVSIGHYPPRSDPPYQQQAPPHPGYPPQGYGAGSPPPPSDGYGYHPPPGQPQPYPMAPPPQDPYPQHYPQRPGPGPGYGAHHVHSPYGDGLDLHEEPPEAPPMPPAPPQYGSRGPSSMSVVVGGPNSRSSSSPYTGGSSPAQPSGRGAQYAPHGMTSPPAAPQPGYGTYPPPGHYAQQQRPFQPQQQQHSSPHSQHQGQQQQQQHPQQQRHSSVGSISSPLPSPAPPAREQPREAPRPSSIALAMSGSFNRDALNSYAQAQRKDTADTESRHSHQAVTPERGAPDDATDHSDSRSASVTHSSPRGSFAGPAGVSVTIGPTPSDLAAAQASAAAAIDSRNNSFAASNAAAKAAAAAATNTSGATMGSSSSGPFALHFAEGWVLFVAHGAVDTAHSSPNGSFCAPVMGDSPTAPRAGRPGDTLPLGFISSLGQFVTLWQALRLERLTPGSTVRLWKRRQMPAFAQCVGPEASATASRLCPPHTSLPHHLAASPQGSPSGSFCNTPADSLNCTVTSQGDGTVPAPASIATVSATVLDMTPGVRVQAWTDVALAALGEAEFGPHDDDVLGVSMTIHSGAASPGFTIDVHCSADAAGGVAAKAAVEAHFAGLTETLHDVVPQAIAPIATTDIDVTEIGPDGDELDLANNASVTSLPGRRRPEQLQRVSSSGALGRTPKQGHLSGRSSPGAGSTFSGGSARSRLSGSFRRDPELERDSVEHSQQLDAAVVAIADTEARFDDWVRALPQGAEAACQEAAQLPQYKQHKRTVLRCLRTDMQYDSQITRWAQTSAPRQQVCQAVQQAGKGAGRWRDLFPETACTLDKAPQGKKFFEDAVSIQRSELVKPKTFVQMVQFARHHAVLLENAGATSELILSHFGDPAADTARWSPRTSPRRYSPPKPRDSPAARGLSPAASPEPSPTVVAADRAEGHRLSVVVTEGDEAMTIPLPPTVDRGATSPLQLEGSMTTTPVPEPCSSPGPAEAGLSSTDAVLPSAGERTPEAAEEAAEEASEEAAEEAAEEAPEETAEETAEQVEEEAAGGDDASSATPAAEPEADPREAESAGASLVGSVDTAGMTKTQIKKLRKEMARQRRECPEAGVSQPPQSESPPMEPHRTPAPTAAPPKSTTPPPGLLQQGMRTKAVPKHPLHADDACALSDLGPETTSSTAAHTGSDPKASPKASPKDSPKDSAKGAPRNALPEKDKDEAKRAPDARKDRRDEKEKEGRRSATASPAHSHKDKRHGAKDHKPKELHREHKDKDHRDHRDHKEKGHTKGGGKGPQESSAAKWGAVAVLLIAVLGGGAFVSQLAE